jgi:pyrroline-5-carboxylate reductase
VKVSIIGCGTMGQALAQHFAKKHTLFLCDRNQIKRSNLAKKTGGQAVGSIKSAFAQAEVILLAVKPKDFTPLVKESSNSKGKLIISILAGVSMAELKKGFPSAYIVRCMPSLSFIAGAGAIALVEEKGLPEKAKGSVASLLQGLGVLTWMSEEKLEGFTALSGSGLAFALALLEAMTESGIFLGLSAAEAKEFVLQTFEGAIALLRQTGKHPAELKWDVCSPAGTTIAGLRVFEEKGVRSGIMETVIACYKRALEMRGG